MALFWIPFGMGQNILRYLGVGKEINKSLCFRGTFDVKNPKFIFKKWWQILFAYFSKIAFQFSPCHQKWYVKVQLFSINSEFILFIVNLLNSIMHTLLSILNFYIHLCDYVPSILRKVNAVRARCPKYEQKSLIDRVIMILLQIFQNIIFILSANVWSNDIKMFIFELNVCKENTDLPS